MPKKQIWLSPTRLAGWYASGCPQRWKWESEWEPVSEPDAGLNPMEKGTLTHALLEGTIEPNTVTDKTVLGFYERLRSLRDTIVAEVLQAEVLEQFKLCEVTVPFYMLKGNGYDSVSVMWKRKIDAIVRLVDGTIAIVDYKTTMAREWKTIEGQTPQAMGFQSMGYLIPPKKKPAHIKKWPTTVLYLVAGFNGVAKVHRVDWDIDSQTQFYQLVEMAVRAMAPGDFPKVYGKHCLAAEDKGGCALHDMCFGVAGWQDRFQKKERPHAATNSPKE